MGEASWALSSDLRQRVPGHALIEELLRQWDRGTIRVDERGQVDIDDEALSWYRGVQGERRVALELLRLGPEWTVLHSVPIGSGASDIDHVVIGPGGVFTINTKYVRGKTVTFGGMGMRLDAFGVTYIRNAVFEARRTRALLSRAVGGPVPATGIIAFVDPAGIVSKAPAGEGDVPIIVVTDRDLVKTFERPPILPPDQLERIVAAALDPRTWHTRPVASPPGDKITKEFLALEAAIGPMKAPVTAPRVRAARAPSAPRVVRSSGWSAPPRSSGRSRRPRRSLGADFLVMIAKLTMLGVGLWAFSQIWPMFVAGLAR